MLGGEDEAETNPFTPCPTFSPAPWAPDVVLLFADIIDELAWLVWSMVWAWYAMRRLYKCSKKK